MDLYDCFSTDKKEIEPLFFLLVQSNVLIKLENIYFHKKALEKLEEIIRKYLLKEKKLLTKDARTLLKTSRKFAIPLLEYLDKKNITKRDGNFRMLT